MAICEASAREESPEYELALTSNESQGSSVVIYLHKRCRAEGCESLLIEVVRALCTLNPSRRNEEVGERVGPLLTHGIT